MLTSEEIQSRFSEALKLHQEGRLEPALAIYRLLLIQLPASSGIHALLGSANALRGSLSMACVHLQRALRLDPLNTDTLTNYGSTLKRIGDPVKALAYFRKALILAPESALYLRNLGQALFEGKSKTSGLTQLVRASLIHASEAELLFSMAEGYLDEGKPVEALEFFTLGLVYSPDRADPYSKRGFLHQEAGRFSEALVEYQRAIHLEGLAPGLEAMKAFCLRALERFDEAVTLYDVAIQAGFSSPEIWVNRGLSLTGAYRLEESLKSYNRAIVLKPELAEGYLNRGNSLQKLKRHREVLPYYDRAITLNPKLSEVYLNRACLKLILGDYESGWREFERRFDTPFMKGALRIHEKTRALRHLTVQDLKGRRVLVYPEQGLGDVIQFCRYAPLLIQQRAHVFIEAPPPLFEILQSLDPEITVLPTGHHLQDFDLMLPVMSLPALLATRLDTIPQKIPYLHANATKTKAWDARLAWSKRPRIGLVWSGGLIQQVPDILSVQKLRNMDLNLMAPFKVVDADFFSLQKGENGEKQLRDLTSQGWLGPEITNYADEFHSFEDTAAFIENLDLVISVDTSTAHLAGALGKPVWILNRFDTCWRWFIDRVDSPWYPTVTLFRQDGSRSWEPVIDQVLKALIQRYGVRQLTDNLNELA